MASRLHIKCIAPEGQIEREKKMAKKTLKKSKKLQSTKPLTRNAP